MGFNNKYINFSSFIIKIILIDYTKYDIFSELFTYSLYSLFPIEDLIYK